MAQHEKFEAWMVGQGCDVSKIDIDGLIYISRDVQDCWITWQAALAASPRLGVEQFLNDAVERIETEPRRAPLPAPHMLLVIAWLRERLDSTKGDV